MKKRSRQSEIKILFKRIGILIRTIIFIIGIHVNQDQMFSDEEVIRRAKALGMVMDETDGKTINELDKDKKQDSESKDQKDSQKEDSTLARMMIVSTER